VGIVFRQADFLASLSSSCFWFYQTQFSAFSELPRIVVKMDSSKQFPIAFLENHPAGCESILFNHGSQFHFNNQPLTSNLMRASNIISRLVLALMVLSVASMGLLITLRLAVKAQDSPAASPCRLGWTRTLEWCRDWRGAPRRMLGVLFGDRQRLGHLDVADAFHYLYQPMNGDGQIVARVLGLQGVNSYAKAGVMIRETPRCQFPNVMAWTTLSRGTYLHWRLETGGVSGETAGSTDLCRRIGSSWCARGTGLGGYSSPDGTNWTLVGSETIGGLASQVFCGDGGGQPRPARIALYRFV